VKLVNVGHDALGVPPNLMIFRVFAGSNPRHAEGVVPYKINQPAIQSGNHAGSPLQ